MKVKQIGKNLVQLTRMGAFSCYFVREVDGLTLVDTGLSGSAKGIIKAAEALGQPIKRIVLTHAHADHAGSLDALATAVSNVDILMTARTAQFLSGNVMVQAGEPQDKLRGSFIKAETKPTAQIQAGDTIGSLNVIASPGHTPDHVSFFDERDGTLIAGDAFQTKAGTAVAGTVRWLFPFPAMATWHKPTALESAKALLALNPKRLAVGHGDVIENPAQEMKRAIEEATHG